MTKLRQQRFQLERLLRLRQQALSQLEQRLGQLVQHRSRERAKLRQLQQAIVDLLDLPIKDQQAKSAATWELRTNYADRLRGRVQRQQQVLAETEARWQQGRKEHAQVKAKVELMEKLIQRQTMRQRSAAIKSEQRSLDELMLSRRHQLQHENNARQQ